MTRASAGAIVGALVCYLLCGPGPGVGPGHEPAWTRGAVVYPAGRPAPPWPSPADPYGLGARPEPDLTGPLRAAGSAAVGPAAVVFDTLP